MSISSSSKLAQLFATGGLKNIQFANISKQRIWTSADYLGDYQSEFAEYDGQKCPIPSIIRTSTVTVTCKLNTTLDPDIIAKYIPIIPYEDQREGIIRTEIRYKYAKEVITGRRGAQTPTSIPPEEIPAPDKPMMRRSGGGRTHYVSKAELDNNTEIDPLTPPDINEFPPGTYQMTREDTKARFWKFSRGTSKKIIMKTAKKQKKVFYNQATIIYRSYYDGDGRFGGTSVAKNEWREINVKIFANGSLQLTGNPTLEHADRIIRNIAADFAAFHASGHSCLGTPETLEVTHVESQLVNADFDFGFPIMRNVLYEIITRKCGLFASFDQNHYQGVNIKFFWNDITRDTPQFGKCICEDQRCDKKVKPATIAAAKAAIERSKITGRATSVVVPRQPSCKKVTIAPFQTGKVIITGARNIQQVMDCYNFITRVVRDYYGVIFNRPKQDIIQSSGQLDNAAKNVIKRRGIITITPFNQLPKKRGQLVSLHNIQNLAEFIDYSRKIMAYTDYKLYEELGCDFNYIMKIDKIPLEKYESTLCSGQTCEYINHNYSSDELLTICQNPEAFNYDKIVPIVGCKIPAHKLDLAQIKLADLITPGLAIVPADVERIKQFVVMSGNIRKYKPRVRLTPEQRILRKAEIARLKEEKAARPKYNRKMRVEKSDDGSIIAKVDNINVSEGVRRGRKKKNVANIISE